MEKTDLSKRYKTYYTAKTTPQIVELEAAHYLSLTGKGDPGSPEFAAVIEALYTVAYTLKFMQKAKGRDFVVAKLEGLWWFDEKKFAGATMSTAPTEIPRSEWEYRLMIRLPEEVDQSTVTEAARAAAEKKSLPAAAQVHYFKLHEQRAVQILHVGPFSREPETLAVLQEFMSGHEMQRNGLHHEIYLSDFRKTPEAKLKTILREPIK